MPSIGSTTQRRAAPTGYSRTGRCGWQESKKMEPQMHADARRWIRIRHGLHGGYRSRRSWQASLKRWSLSRPRASPCICGSSFLLSRPLHPAAGEAGLHREQNPMHQFGTVRRGRRLGRRVARRRQGPMHLFGRPSHLPGLAAWRQNPMHQKQSPGRRRAPSRPERT